MQRERGGNSPNKGMEVGTMEGVVESVVPQQAEANLLSFLCLSQGMDKTSLSHEISTS